MRVMPGARARLPRPPHDHRTVVALRKDASAWPVPGMIDGGPREAVPLKRPSHVVGGRALSQALLIARVALDQKEVRDCGKVAEDPSQVLLFQKVEPLERDNHVETARGLSEFAPGITSLDVTKSANLEAALSRAILNRSPCGHNFEIVRSR